MQRELSDIRFIQLTSKYDRHGKKRAYERTFRFHGEDGRILWCCDIYGAGISEPTVFTSQINHPDDSFRMVAKRKLLNATYNLEETSGAPFGLITRKGFGHRWKLMDEDATETARIVTPESRTAAFVRESLAALPDSFAIESMDDVVATIATEPLCEHIEREPLNALGRLVRKVIPETGMTLRVISDAGSSIDVRSLVASMTLLQVHDISGALRN